jgi:hypothetical protein
MTLIIGILCQDGIVVGADGAATMGVLGMQTAKQSVKKLTLHHNCIITGVSGSVGLSQRINGTIATLYGEGKQLTGKKPFQAMPIIGQRIWLDCLKQEYDIAVEAQKLIGGNLAQQSCLCSSVLAMPISKELCLFQFNHQAHPEMATKDIPFIAIGSGQFCADPFLAFIRRIFWPDRLPHLSEGIFATYWTLDQAIKTSPGGVAEPKQIAVLETKDGKSVCRELTEAEIDPIKEAVTNTEKHLREINQKAPEAAPPIPAPPVAQPAV